MPYVNVQKPKARQGQEEPDEKRSISSAVGGAPPTAPIAGAGASAPGQGERPGQFVNLQRYMDANAGQAKTMADKLAGGVEAAGRSASGMPTFRPDSRGQALGERAPGQDGPAPLAGGQKFAPGAQQSRPGMAPPGPPAPGSAAPDWRKSDPQMVAPPSQDALAAKYDATDAAQDQARMLGTAGGRQELLTNAYGKTSQGESDLDNFLAGQASGGRFERLAKQYGGLTQEMMDQDARYGASYRADQQRRVNEAEDFSRVVAGRVAANARRDEERARQAQAEVRQLEMAQRSGYHGNDLAGAQSWYYQKFGPAAYAEAFPGAAIPGGM